MILHLPQGENTVIINVKTKKTGFYPTLYVTHYSGKAINSLMFPPSDLIHYGMADV